MRALEEEEEEDLPPSMARFSSSSLRRISSCTAASCLRSLESSEEIWERTEESRWD